MAVSVKAKYESKERAEAMWNGLKAAAAMKLRTGNVRACDIKEHTR